VRNHSTLILLVRGIS